MGNWELGSGHGEWEWGTGMGNREQVSVTLTWLPVLSNQIVGVVSKACCCVSGFWSVWNIGDVGVEAK